MPMESEPIAGMRYTHRGGEAPVAIANDSSAICWVRTMARPDLGEADPGKSRACPACGARVVFFEWPGDEVCLDCGQLLYVNSTGQVSHSPIGDLPDP
jgi:hypothetical protein